MGIFLIIIGVVLGFIFIPSFFSSTTATKNKENWESFYQEAEKHNFPVSEEELYRLTCKISLWSGILSIIGILLVTGGILMLVL